MKYPKDFVAAVKRELPRESTLHKALEAGGQIVGRYLDDSSTGGFDPERIVKMIDQGKAAQLRAEAAKLLRRKQLYAQWNQMWYGPDNHPLAD